MKNLIIFVSPIKLLSPEYDDLIKIQIDNSFALGWKATDIVFAANFDYEYKGVKSTIVADYNVFDQNRSTKIPVIIELFNKNLIKKDTYWFHDFDAFQLVPFEVKLEKDAGFTTHGVYSKTWNAGSFFFGSGAKDIFVWINDWMNKRGTNEQNALTYMWQINFNNVYERCQMLDSSYNLGIYKVDENIKNSEVPIKVAHFHPHKKHHLEIFNSRNLLHLQLLEIFKKYGIK